MPPFPLSADETPPLPPFSVELAPANAPAPAEPAEPSVAPAVPGAPPPLDTAPPEAVDPPPAVTSLLLSGLELEHADALSTPAAKNSPIAEL
jgi:hypothetical protein